MNSRSDDAEVSLGDTESSIFFSFSQQGNPVPLIDIDPRMGSFKMWQQLTYVDDVDGLFKFTRKEILVEQLTPERFPEYFEDQELIPYWLQGGWGAIPVSSQEMNIKNLMNSFEIIPNSAIVAAIVDC